MDFDWRNYASEHPRFGRYYQTVAARPSWVTRAAVAAILLVIVVPVVLLVLAALLVGLVVFTVLGLVARLLAILTGTRAPGSFRRAAGNTPSPGTGPRPRNRPRNRAPADPARRNVRVIDP